MKLMQIARHLLLIPALLLALSACNTVAKYVPFMGPPRTDLDSLRVTATADANGDVATRLDLVFVYDLSSVDLLPKTSVEWFQQRAQILAAQAEKLEALSLELPPLTDLNPVGLPKRYAKAYRVLAYADYQAKTGQGVLELSPYSRPQLRLEAERIVLVPKRP